MRRGAQNLALASGSVLAVYLVFELILFPLSWVHLPHRLQWRISSPLLVINQNTRRHRLPRDYIAVVGDSHAIGIISDEAGLARWSSRGRASNALLFEKTGTDVLAIGQGGG